MNPNNSKNNIINLFSRKILLGLLGLLVLSIVPSCKSHKKNKVEDRVYTEGIIEVKKKKKGKQKELSIGERIAEEAITWIGTPYAYARQDKGVATDCSGLVFVIYQEIAEIKLPRNSALQADFCTTLKEKEVEAGDLVFFATGADGKKVSHVGVMIDREKFVHASGSKGVIISEMTTPYYRRNLVKFGRVPIQQ